MRYQMLKLGEGYCVIDTWRDGEIIWQSMDEIATRDYANEVNRLNQARAN
jgi:hypothetical protein